MTHDSIVLELHTAVTGRLVYSITSEVKIGVIPTCTHAQGNVWFLVSMLSREKIYTLKLFLPMQENP